MEMDDISSAKVAITKAKLGIMLQKVKVHWSTILKIIHIQDNGLMIYPMGKVSRSGKMGQNIKEIF